MTSKATATTLIRCDACGWSGIPADCAISDPDRRASHACPFCRGALSLKQDAPPDRAALHTKVAVQAYLAGLSRRGAVVDRFGSSEEGRSRASIGSIIVPRRIQPD